MVWVAAFNAAAFGAVLGSPVDMSTAPAFKAYAGRYEAKPERFGPKDNSVTGGHLCVKGRLGFEFVQNREDEDR